MFSSTSVLARHWAARLLLAAFASLGIAILTAACGDPGTGGSGVPTAASGPAGNSGQSTGENGSNQGGTSTGGTSTGSPNQAAPNSDSTVPPSQGSNGLTSSPGSASQASTSGIIEIPVAGATTTPTGSEIQVAGTRFAIGSATLLGTDGLARTADRLLPGVPVLLGYPASADLAAAAVGATGAAVAVERVTVTDPLAGVLTDSPVPSRVLLDNGNTVTLSAQAIRVGIANPGNRVRAWIFGAGSSALVTRVEFD